MNATLQAFWTGFPVFLLHAGVTALILFAGAFLYALLTPHKELDLIRKGNTAAALSFGAVIVGLAIPLAFCMATSLSLLDIVLWGVATLIVQMALFRLADVLLPRLPKRIEEGDVAAAAFLAAIKLSAAAILAAAVAGTPIVPI